MNDCCQNSLISAYLLKYAIPLAAIIVSIFSIWFSVLYSRKTLNLTKEHNKKIVEPMLTHLYMLDIRGNSQSLQIKNCGFGPALIKSVIFSVDGKQYEKFNLLITENMKNADYKADYNINNLGDCIIASNELIVMFKLDFENKGDNNGFMKFRELARRTSLNIKYETVYGESKKLYASMICEN
jgi:hypothetical protein